MLPEIRLYLARDAFGLWERIERDTGQRQLPPPFWAFPWAGGQALARYLLDHPAQVRGRAVLDLASGSGLVAIAAAAAGAASVTPSETDPLAAAAITLNAGVNRVRLEPAVGDLLAAPGPARPDTARPGVASAGVASPGPARPDTARPGVASAGVASPGPARPDTARPGVASAGVASPGVVLAGDAFYDRDMASLILPFLERASHAGALVLVGDPGRAYLPRDRFDQVTTYDVPVERVIEDADVKPTTVWRLR